MSWHFWSTADVAQVQLELRCGADPNATTSWGATPLHWATENENPAMVRALLDAGADPDAKIDDGWTPLHRAASNENPAVVEALLDAGADPESKDRWGQTPLHWAAGNENAEVLRALLAAGADRDAKDHRGKMPLHRAAWNENPAVVEALLDAGADVNAVDAAGRMPLHWATMRENPAVVLVLLGAGAHINAVDAAGRTPLLLASRWNDHPAVVRALLDAGAEPVPALCTEADLVTEEDWVSEDFWRTTDVASVRLELRCGAPTETGRSAGVLRLAAQYSEHPAVVQMLLDAGADPDASDGGGTSVHYAASFNGNPAVVRVLLDAGADLEAKDEGNQTPLYLAARNGNRAVVRVLLGAGADPGCPTGTPEEDWVSEDFWREVDLAQVQFELRCGADTEAKDDDGRTPLHYAAAWNEHPVVVLALPDAGADLEAKDRYGRTPLHWAATNENPAVLRALLDAGADPAAKDDDGGRTPLHVAALSGSPSSIAALIEGGADIEARAYFGTGAGGPCGGSDGTALWAAVRWGSAANARALIDGGANIDGELMYWAAACSGPDEVQVLIEAGADLEYMLFPAVRRGPANIGVLLAAGADVATRRADGSTPLHEAAGWSEPASVRALVEAGADVEARNALGRTPLHIAASMQYYDAWEGSIETFIALIEAGSDVEARDDEGQTPLHVAARRPEADWGQPASQTKIGVLLAAGADIEARDGRGRTPLQLAAGLAADVPGRPEIVMKLLESGAGGDDAITTSTGWRIIVDSGVAAATRGGRTVMLFVDKTEVRDHDPEPQAQEKDYPPDEQSWNRMLSAVGSIVSIETSYYYEGGPGVSYATTWRTIDLETGEPSSLTAIFPEDEILAALLADAIVREAYRGGGEPNSLSELIEDLDGGCEVWFSHDMLADFAFHHIQANRVAVRIGLTHGCEVMRGNFTQIGLDLDIPPVLSEALRRASVDGSLMETLSNR